MAQHEVWVVTGASRGIGAELVHQILERPNATVIAGARRPNDAQLLQKLRDMFSGRLHLLHLDVTSQQSVQEAVSKVREFSSRDGVDYLINNAGINQSVSRARTEDSETLRQALDTNCIGAHRVTQAFLPLLQAGSKKTVINVSTLGASLDWNAKQMANPGQLAVMMPRVLGYKTSKAALNMLTLGWAADVSPAEGFTFVAIHPGQVMTDMVTDVMSKLQIDSSQEKEHSSSGDASVAANDAMKPDALPPDYDPPGQCIAKMLQTILNLKPVDSGKFLNNEGATLPY